MGAAMTSDPAGGTNNSRCCGFGQPFISVLFIWALVNGVVGPIAVHAGVAGLGVWQRPCQVAAISDLQ